MRFLDIAFPPRACIFPPGQLGLVQSELGGHVHALQEEEGHAGEGATATGLLQLERVKLPLIDKGQGGAKLREGGAGYRDTDP